MRVKLKKKQVNNQNSKTETSVSGGVEQRFCPKKKKQKKKCWGKRSEVTWSEHVIRCSFLVTPQRVEYCSTCRTFQSNPSFHTAITSPCLKFPPECGANAAETIDFILFFCDYDPFKDKFERNFVFETRSEFSVLKLKRKKKNKNNPEICTDVE